jgi:hypothetical protein
MGWLFGYERFASKNEAKEFLQHRLNNDWSDGVETLESAIVNDVYYAAVKKPDGVVFCSVCLIDYDKNNNGISIGYKGMSESEGPFRFSCPRSILDRLTAPCNYYAYIWREICYKRLPRAVGYPPDREDNCPDWTIEEAKEWAKAEAKRLKTQKGKRLVLKDGDYIVLREGVSLTIGDRKFTRFKVVNVKLGMLIPINNDGSFDLMRRVPNYRRFVESSYIPSDSDNVTSKAIPKTKSLFSDL